MRTGPTLISPHARSTRQDLPSPTGPFWQMEIRASGLFARQPLLAIMLVIILAFACFGALSGCTTGPSPASTANPYSMILRDSPSTLPEPTPLHRTDSATSPASEDRTRSR